MTATGNDRVTYRTVLDLSGFVDAGVGLTPAAVSYAKGRMGHLVGDVDVHIGTAMLADESVIAWLAHALRNASTVTVHGDTPAIIALELARALWARP